MSVSDYAENKILDAVFRHTTTGGGLPTANPYVALHTADPTDTGSGAEVTGGSYARQQAAFDAAASGATTNSAIIDHTGMPAVTVTHVGIWDASTAGNLLWSGARSGGGIVIGAGNTHRIAAGDLDVTLD
jgi:hypothetical protein